MNPSTAQLALYVIGWLGTVLIVSVTVMHGRLMSMFHKTDGPTDPRLLLELWPQLTALVRCLLQPITVASRVLGGEHRHPLDRHGDPGHTDDGASPPRKRTLEGNGQ